MISILIFWILLTFLILSLIIKSIEFDLNEKIRKLNLKILKEE